MGVADTNGPPNYMLIYLVFGKDEMETVTLQTLEKPNKIEKIEANRNTLLTQSAKSEDAVIRLRMTAKVLTKLITKFLTEYTSVDDSAVACMAIARISVFFRVLIFFRWAVLKGGRASYPIHPPWTRPCTYKISKYFKV